MLDTVQGTALRQPLGNFETRCDEKGRVRLPSNWLHFFTHELKDTRVFATSLNGTVLRIYPESIWRANLLLFETHSELSPEIEHTVNIANHYGVITELDANGRVLINTHLRTDMKLVGDMVVGTGKKGVIHVYREEDYSAMIAASRLAVPDAIAALTKLGMR